MVQSYEQTKDKLSRLSFILAMSRVSMLSLKLQAKMRIDKEDFSTAKALRNHFKVCLEEAIEPNELPDESVPDASLRSVIQRTFATTGPGHNEFIFNDINSLSKAVDLLSILVKKRKLEKNQAIDLSEIIRCLRFKSDNLKTNIEPETFAEVTSDQSTGSQ